MSVKGLLQWLFQHQGLKKYIGIQFKMFVVIIRGSVIS